MSKKLVAFKGFNKNLTCRDFQYAEGGEYETQNARLCAEGFHACEKPIDCLQYYDPATSVYHQVELDEVSDERTSNDTKVVAKKIKIGARLDVPMICKLTFDYVKEHCTNEQNAEPGKPATAGNRGAATAGEYGAATAGEYGCATSRGKSATGKNGLSVARGSNVRVKGDAGAVLVIAQENTFDYEIKHVRTAIVGENGIEPDTWYTLDDEGNFVKC